MTSKYISNQTRNINKDNISDDANDFETDVGIVREQLQTIIERTKAAKNYEADEKVEKEKYKLLYSNSVGQFNVMDNKMNYMQNHLHTYKTRKGIKDVDL